MTTTPIDRATLTEPPQRRVDLANASPLWVGNALQANGQKPRLWLRQLPAAQLLAECFATQAGRLCGLPIPRPFLVFDPQHLITPPHAPPLFGSLDAEHPSLRQRIAHDGDQAVKEALRRWPLLRQCGCFDEHVGNVDRNLGNVLFDGEEEWVPIDQAYSFGGPHRWPAQPPAAQELMINQVLNELLSLGSQLESLRLKPVFESHRTTSATVAWQRLIDDETLELMGGKLLYPVLVRFMEQRLPELPILLHTRAQLFDDQRPLSL